MSLRDGGSAFPSDTVEGIEFGMTMRQQYKVACATSMVGYGCCVDELSDKERARYASRIGKMADALIAEDAEHEKQEVK